MKGWRKQLQESGILIAGLVILAGVTAMAALPFISNPALLYFLAVLVGLAATAAGILLIVTIRRARRTASSVAEPLQNEERMRLALEGAVWLYFQVHLWSI